MLPREHPWGLCHLQPGQGFPLWHPFVAPLGAHLCYPTVPGDQQLLCSAMGFSLDCAEQQHQKTVLLPALPWNYGIMESFRLEKHFKVIKSNC